MVQRATNWLGMVILLVGLGVLTAPLALWSWLFLPPLADSRASGQKGPGV